MVSGAPHGYRLALPSGWQRITTGDGGAESQRHFLEVLLRTRSDSERVFAQRELAPRLASALARAEDNGTLDIYAYHRIVRGLTVTMAFTVSIMHVGIPLSDAELLALATGDSSAETELVTLGNDEQAARSVETREESPAEFRARLAEATDADPADGDAEVAEAERTGVRIRITRISYLVPIPEVAGAFLLIVSDIADGPLAEAKQFHFDAVVSTLGWV